MSKVEKKWKVIKHGSWKGFGLHNFEPTMLYPTNPWQKKRWKDKIVKTIGYEEIEKAIKIVRWN